MPPPTLPLEILRAPHGEPKSLVGGRLGAFTFRCAWVYWCVSGEMSFADAHRLNTEIRPIGGTKYSGGAGAWGDVIRVEGYSGGTDVRDGGCDSWHIDTQDGLEKFAQFVAGLAATAHAPDDAVR